MERAYELMIILEGESDDFAFDFDKFELISRAPALWNMARNKDMDEYEYIYKSKHLSFN